MNRQRSRPGCSPTQRAALYWLVFGGDRAWRLYHGNTWNALVRRGLVVRDDTDDTPEGPYRVTGGGMIIAQAERDRIGRARDREIALRKADLERGA